VIHLSNSKLKNECENIEKELDELLGMGILLKDSIINAFRYNLYIMCLNEEIELSKATEIYKNIINNDQEELLGVFYKGALIKLSDMDNKGKSLKYYKKYKIITIGTVSENKE